MRTIRARADRLLEQRERRRERTLRGAVVALSLLLITALSLMMPRVRGSVFTSPEGAYGSMLLESPAASYVVIGVLSFLLGIIVTLFCIRLSRSRKRDRVRQW